ELCRAVRIVRLHAEPTQGFAALLDGALQLRTEAVGSQGLILNSIEPDGTRMADLGLERKRLLADEQAVTNGQPALPLGERLEQVGQDPPAVGRCGCRQAEALKFAETPLERV